MRTKILTTMVAVCLAASVTQPLHAEDSRTISRSAPRSAAMGIALRPAEQIAGGQYPQQALEDLRGEILNLADGVQEFAALAPPGLVDTTNLQQARGLILQMSSRDLNALRKGIDPSKLHAQLLQARAAVAEYSKAKSGPTTSAGPMHIESLPFPVANGFCTSANGSDVTRIPTGVIIAADVIYFIAETVYELAQDACNEVLVIGGEGGNVRLLCIITDTIWVVAHAVDEGIHFCGDDLTGAVVDANYSRLDHIHNDLAAVQTTADAIDTHITNVNNQITGEFTALDTHLTNVDTHIANEFTALDTHIANEFTALDTHMVSLFAALSAQLTGSTDLLSADLKQVMKLELTPEGLRKIVPEILTCTVAADNCPNVLTKCTGSGGACSWNNVGPLP
jgi:hypothetical protein